MKKTLPKPLKKIAIVSDAIYPYNKGGKEKRIHELSTRLAKMGHDVHIYTMKWWDGPSTITKDGVHLHAISRHYPLYAGERRSIKQGLLFGLACLRLMNQEFDLIDADHMPHFPLFSLKIVSMAKQKPLYVVWHEVWGRRYWVEYMGVSGNIAALVEWLSVRMPSHIVSASDHTSELLRHNLKYKGKLDTINNGIDFDHIRGIQPAKDTQIDIIFAGRLLRHKGLQLLLMSIAELRHRKVLVNCVVVGDGPEKPELELTIRTLGLEDRVTLLPFMESHDELYALIKSAKVFVLPSYREGFGIVALEANACGTPVVTNNVATNAARDLIDEGYNGYLFEPTISNLATRLELALGTHDTMEQYCIDTAQDHDWSHLAEKTAGVYGT